MKAQNLLVLFFTILAVSCSKNNEVYKPIQGYYGKVKQITNYQFKNDYEKNRQISKYNYAVPKEIKEYNRFGLLEKTMKFELDYDNNYCFIKADSICYDSNQEKTLEIHYLVGTKVKEISNFSDLIRIVNSTTPTDVEITRKQIINDEFNFVDNIVIVDTTKYEYEYQNNLLVSMSTIEKFGTRKVQYKYNNGLLLSTTDVNHDNDTTITNYIYDNGTLTQKEIETDNKTSIEKYDSKGRMIYYTDSLFEHYNVYYDTITVSSLCRKKDKYFDENCFITLTKTNKENLLLFEANISLANKRKYYEDDVMILIEKYKDNKILENDFINEVEKIISKIPSNYNYTKIKIISYDNYDLHGNPLKKRYNNVNFSWSSYRYDVIKDEEIKMHEVAISYHE